MEKIGKPQIDGVRIKFSEPRDYHDGLGPTTFCRLSFRKAHLADTPDDAAWQTILVGRFHLRPGEALSDRTAEWEKIIRAEAKRLIDEAVVVKSGI